MSGVGKSANGAQQSRALEGLPKQFVTAMRTLFDVLDDSKSGQVALADIEMWWRKDKEEGGMVPNGVIESLRKVTPTSGNLTFERFCAGLKICLLRSHKENKLDTSESNDGLSCNSESEDISQRVKSLRKQRFAASPSPSLALPPRLDVQPLLGPPKPPRALEQSGRRAGDGGPSLSDNEERRSEASRKQPKRRESHSRRHTLQSGIDYGLLKRMKAIEEERDVLLQGAQTVERAKDWYHEQLAGVHERMRNLGKPGLSSQEHVGSTEAAKERLVFQFARIQEVNQHLNCLMNSDMSFPMSMNLAVGKQRERGEMERQISRLKDQNKLLTEEVGKKCTSITVLEQEKSALIRELFQARSRVRQTELNEGEATFM